MLMCALFVFLLILLPAFLFKEISKYSIMTMAMAVAPKNWKAITSIRCSTSSSETYFVNELNWVRAINPWTKRWWWLFFDCPCPHSLRRFGCLCTHSLKRTTRTHSHIVHGRGSMVRFILLWDDDGFGYTIPKLCLHCNPIYLGMTWENPYRIKLILHTISTYVNMWNIYFSYWQGKRRWKI